MISLLIAVLIQTAPDASAQAGRGDGLPKGDYERVAWCHGALAGQLELEPIAKADMEKIEGKAKVAARAKGDAEMLKERRQYLKDYEKALSAAEAASLTMIHQKGVAAEQQGYRLWTATRNKEPVWRILDWGMWDPNDAGCSEAAERLLNKSQLFGAALKSDEKPEIAEAPAAEVTKPAETLAEAAPAPAPPPVVDPAPPPAPTIEGPPPTPATPATVAPDGPTDASTIPSLADGEAARVSKPARAKTPKAPLKPVKVAAKPKPVPKPKASSAEAIRDAIASGKAELEKPVETPSEPAPAPVADPPPLRGPQRP